MEKKKRPQSGFQGSKSDERTSIAEMLMWEDLEKDEITIEAKDLIIERS